jgi:hypothetical protein
MLFSTVELRIDKETSAARPLAIVTCVQDAPESVIASFGLNHKKPRRIP